MQTPVWIKYLIEAVGVALLVLLFIFARPIIFQPKNFGESISKVIDSKKLILPSGLQIYKITQAAELSPKIVEASIDPPDVHVGDTQRLSVILEDSQVISVVEARIETDNGITTVPLYEKKRDDGKITYGNEWIVKDTHNITYHTTFFAKDVGGRANSITLAWSDACGIPAGGDWTNASNCTISSTDGVDNGNITLSAGTLTLNADFAFNPGKSITINGGSIAIAAGKSLKQTYLWAIDADIDSYPDTGTQYAQDTAPTNGRRRNLVTGPNIDCNSADASQFTNATQWTDSDGDGHAGTDVIVCAQGGTIGSNDDCNDSNANIFQNQVVVRDADSDAYADSYVSPLAPPECVGNLASYSISCDWIGAGGGGSCVTGQYNDQYGCASWRTYASARKDGGGALIIDSSIGGFDPPGCPAL